MAEPGGLIRPFVELGPPMADLLNRLIKKNVAVEYIEKILAAFPHFRFDETFGLRVRLVPQQIQEFSVR